MGLLNNIATEVKDRIHQLARDGVTHSPEMQRHLDSYVNRDLFPGHEKPDPIPKHGNVFNVVGKARHLLF